MQWDTSLIHNRRIHLSVSHPSRLILFDIDGTLLTAGGAPRRAFRRALIEHFGTDGDEARTDYSGKTDPQIVYEIMGGAGFDVDTNAVTIVGPDGAEPLPLQTKGRVAAEILNRVEKLLSVRGAVLSGPPT